MSGAKNRESSKWLSELKESFSQLSQKASSSGLPLMTLGDVELWISKSRVITDPNLSKSEVKGLCKGLSTKEIDFNQFLRVLKELSFRNNSNKDKMFERLVKLAQTHSDLFEKSIVKRNPNLGDGCDEGENQDDGGEYVNKLLGDTKSILSSLSHVFKH